MVYKIILLIFFFTTNHLNANIIYDKNDISISDIELNKYIELHNFQYSILLNKNKALKNLILIKKTIKFLIINNNDYIKSIDENLMSENGERIFNDNLQLDFYRFMKIRNDFISNYFQNKFNSFELKLIFNSFKELKFPLSRNNCMTINQILDLSEDDFFIKNYYDNLKNNTYNFKTFYDDAEYSVCVDNKSLKIIENEIINFIKEKTDEEFNNFIYNIKN